VEFRGHTALGVELLTLPKARRQAAGEAEESLRGPGGGVPMLSDEDQLAKNEAGWTGRSLAWYQFFGKEVWPGTSDRTWYRLFRREAMVVVVAVIVLNVMALFLVRRRVERRHEAAG
jgi:hypothetical protein